MPPASTTSMKLDSDTRERIQRIAVARRRTPHWIMREAIGEYLDREEKRQQVHQDALAAWLSYQESGLHVSATEADAWLSKLESGKIAKPPKCRR